MTTSYFKPNRKEETINLRQAEDFRLTRRTIAGSDYIDLLFADESSRSVCERLRWIMPAASRQRSIVDHVRARTETALQSVCLFDFSLVLSRSLSDCFFLSSRSFDFVDKLITIAFGRLFSRSACFSLARPCLCERRGSSSPSQIKFRSYPLFPSASPSSSLSTRPLRFAVEWKTR